jgi:hypothetical protein
VAHQQEELERLKAQIRLERNLYEQQIQDWQAQVRLQERININQNGLNN